METKLIPDQSHAEMLTRPAEHLQGHLLSMRDEDCSKFHGCKVETVTSSKNEKYKQLIESYRYLEQSFEVKHLGRMMKDIVFSIYQSLVIALAFSPTSVLPALGYYILKKKVKMVCKPPFESTLC
jgi:hypothetical protein